MDPSAGTATSSEIVEMREKRLNTPNVITVARIVITPFIAWLIMADGLDERRAAFLVFVAAAVSDVVDGRIARSNEEVTRFGQLLDPIADKLLLLVTLLPLFGMGLLPLWFVILILGRDFAMTAFRRFALSRGELITASSWGKWKTVIQNWFIGSILVLRINEGYFARGEGGAAWEWWQGYTLAVIGVGFWFVVALTVFSFLDYLVTHRRLWTARAA
jgi:CDP-diacylglycerol---glycerol-3-phosphate 3-phosphatidyltransferase